MRRCIGLLIGACFLVGLTPLAGMAQAPAPGSPVQLVKVYPNKVRYLRGEKGAAQVTLRNTSQTDQTVTLESEIAQELTRVTPLPPREVTVPANGDVTLDLPFTAPMLEYGCALRVRAVKGETALAQGQDMFGVSDSLWNIAVGANIMDWMDASIRSNPPNGLKIARANYFNWWEKMFWSPDMFGELTPSEERWYSGQGGRPEIKKVIKECAALAKANGIASVTYSINTSGGPAGWELARRRPDWFQQDAAGRILGVYDTDIFARWDSSERLDRGWWYLYPNLTREDVLDHAINEILNSSLEYGWDGVRFDGNFTWVGDDEMGAYNQRRVKERILAKLPDYVFGFNMAYPPAELDPARWSHSVRECMAGGGHYMNEGIGINDYAYATNGRYTSYRDYWQREGLAANAIRQVGASYHFIYYLHRYQPVQGQYKFILATSVGAHPVYGEASIAKGCASWGRYLTRWSAFFWDVNLRDLPDTDATVRAAVPLWHMVKARPVDTKTKTTVVHLIVPPSTDSVGDKEVALGEPASQVAVRVRIPADEQVTLAAAIAPEHPDDAEMLPITRDGEWAAVTVPEVKSWTMVVVETAGAFTVPTYAKFTEAPDPARVKRAREAGAMEIISDPLKPPVVPKETSKARTLEMENLYQTQPKVEPDKDASGGYCTRIDYTMSNSSVISHAIFNSVTPGHYRATYRLKLKSKTDEAGKPVGAGFGLFVYLGTKQVWLKQIGPNDFKTPGQYEDFVVEFDFLGEGSTINTGAFWFGQQAGGTVYADKVTLEQLSEFTDADLAARMKVSIVSDISPGEPDGRLDVLVVNGLYNELYRLPEALSLFGIVRDITQKPDAAPAGPDAPKPDGIAEELNEPPCNVRVAYATVQVNDNAAVVRNFPNTYRELCKYDVVALINADASWFMFPGRAMLREFVTSGGGLLVLGGNFTLGQGAFASTFLGDVLPVTLAKARDVQQASKPLQLKPGPTGLARTLPAEVWKAPSYVYWRHLVAAKPEAQAHLYAGQEPVLFTGTYGKGRAAAFTGTVLGEPAGKEQPFWQWSGWPLLMNKTIGWLAQGPAAE